MKSIVAFIVAAAYFFLVIGLLVAREFVTGYIAWQRVYWAVFVLTPPWSLLVFVFVPPVLDAPDSGKMMDLAIHVIGGLINAVIIYMVCAFVSYSIRKLMRSGPE